MGFTLDVNPKAAQFTVEISWVLARETQPVLLPPR